jgi:hypothetical protein
MYKRNCFNFELYVFRFIVTSLCLKKYINDLPHLFGLKIRAVTTYLIEMKRNNRNLYCITYLIEYCDTISNSNF